MINESHAVIREKCPVCGQGRLLLAVTNSRPNNFFILCEDCESEWNSAEDAAYIEMATRDKHRFLRFATLEDIDGQPYKHFVLNK